MRMVSAYDPGDGKRPIAIVSTHRDLQGDGFVSEVLFIHDSSVESAAYHLVTTKVPRMASPWIVIQKFDDISSAMAWGVRVAETWQYLENANAAETLYSDLYIKFCPDYLKFL